MNDNVIPIENFQPGGRFHKRPGTIQSTNISETMVPRDFAIKLAQDSYTNGAKDVLEGLVEALDLLPAGIATQEQIQFALTLIASARLMIGGNAA